MEDLIRLILTIGENTQNYMVLVDKNLKIAWINKELIKKGFKNVKRKTCKSVFINKEEYCDEGRISVALQENRVIHSTEKGVKSATIPISVGNHSFVLVVSKSIDNNNLKLKHIQIKVSDFMTKKIVSTPHTSTLIQATALMSKKKISSIVVTKKGGAVGIITERDIVKFFAKAKKATNVIVEEIMSKPIISIRHNEDITSVAEFFAKHKIRRLLVKKGEKIVGLVTETDILKGAIAKENILKKEQIKTTFKLRENEQKFKNIIEHSDEVHYIHDINHVLSYVSPQCLNIFGYTPKEMKVKWTTLTTDNRINEIGFKTTITAMKTGKRQKSYLLECKRKDGKKIMLEIDESPIKNNKGKVIGIVGAARDVTEDKKREEILRTSEEKFRTLSVNIPGMIYKGYRDWSAEIISNSEQICGYSLKDFATNKINWFELIHPEDKKKVFEGAKSLTKSSKPIIQIYRIIDKNKNIKWIEDHKTPRFKDKKYVGVEGVAFDITERKKSLEQLKQSEERFRVLYETSADAIMTLEPPTWKFTSGNPTTVKIFNTGTEEKFITLGPWDVSPEKQPDGTPSGAAAKNAIMKAMKQGSYFFDWTHKRYKGEAFPATVLLTRVERKGKQFLQATVRDITEQKKAEEALKESESKYRLIVESLRDALYLHDFKGKIIDVNDRACQMLGYSKNELIGSHLSLIDDPEYAKLIKPRMEILIKQGWNFFDGVHIKKDKSKVNVSISTTVLSKDNNGLIQSIVRDVTTQKKAEEEKEKLNQELKQRVADLEKFQKLTVGRELKMIELKNQLKKLKGEVEK